jgi:hypothetical protein
MAKWEKLNGPGFSMWVWRQFAVSSPDGPQRQYTLWVKYAGEDRPTKLDEFPSLRAAKGIAEATYAAVKPSYKARSEAIKEGLRRAERQRLDALEFLEELEKLHPKAN